MGRVKVLKDGQTFLEVRDNRRLDNLTRRLRHQTTHTSQLLHLVLGTTGTGVRHHEDRVGFEYAACFRICFLLACSFHHGVSHFVRTGRPCVDDFVVLLATCDQTVSILTLVFSSLRTGRLNQLMLRFRDDHVVLTEGNAGFSSFTETEAHDLVTEDDRRLLTAVTVDVVDHTTDRFLHHQLVYDVWRHIRLFWKTACDHKAARCRVEYLACHVAVLVNNVERTFDLRVQRNRLAVKRMLELTHIGEAHALARFALFFLCQVIETKNHILRWNDDRSTVCRRQNVVCRHHQNAGFKLSFKRKRNVNSHLVTVEVSVKRCTDERVKLDRFTFNETWFERLNAKTVKRWSAVQKDRVLANNLFEDIPDFRLLFLNQLLRSFNCASQTFRIETRIDERLEQLERHLLRKTTLVQFQRWTCHDYGTTGIVDALTEKVLTETTLLTFQHV